MTAHYSATPLYFGGAKLVGLNPLGPIFDGAGLNVTVLSYLDSVGFGLVACPKNVPDIWRLAGYIPEAFDELRKAADVAPGDGGSEALIEGRVVALQVTQREGGRPMAARG